MFGATVKLERLLKQSNVKMVCLDRYDNFSENIVLTRVNLQITTVNWARRLICIQPGAQTVSFYFLALFIVLFSQIKIVYFLDRKCHC